MNTAPTETDFTSAHPLIEHRYGHFLRASRLGRGEIAAAMKSVSGFNQKTAVFVPAILGSMPFFWFSIVLTLCSLPAVLTLFDTEVLKGSIGLASFFPAVILKTSLVGLVAWIAQTFIQLVALPVLQVSSNATQAQLEAHVAVILDRLDENTAGGVEAVLRGVTGVEGRLTDLSTKVEGALSSKRRSPPY